MLKLTQLREAAGLSRTRLGALASVHPARVGQAENRRVRPYPVELARLAAALDYHDDPETLLGEVDDDRQA
jgi:transcriptional regulator with XRE-family HTH domain